MGAAKSGGVYARVWAPGLFGLGLARGQQPPSKQAPADAQTHPGLRAPGFPLPVSWSQVHLFIHSFSKFLLSPAWVTNWGHILGK